MTKEDLAFIRALRNQGVEVTFSQPPQMQGGFIENTAPASTTAVNIPPIDVENIIAQDAVMRQRAANNADAQRLIQSGVIKQYAQSDPGTIDYSNTDIRRYGEGYVGNPNWSFAAPNMTGKQRADAEAYHADIIGSELLGLGVEKLASKAYGATKQIIRNKNLSKALSTNLDEAPLNPDLIEGVLPKIKQSSSPSLASSDNLILDSKKVKEVQDDIAFTQKAKELQSKVPLTRVVDKSNLVVKDGKLFNSVEPYTVMTGEGLTNTTSARNTSHWSYGHVGDPGHGNWKGKSTAIISDYETLSKKGYALDLDPTDTFFYNSKNMELPEGSLILTRDKKLYDDIIKNTNQKNVKYICIANELPIYNNSYAGTPDRIFFNEETEELRIIDWKTNKDELKFRAGYYKKVWELDDYGNRVRKTKTDKWVTTNEKFLRPLNLVYCKGNTYRLQLSLYAYLCELWGMEHKGNILVHVRHDGEGNELDPVIYLPEKMTYFKSQVAKLLKWNKAKLGGKAGSYRGAVA